MNCRQGALLRLPEEVRRHAIGSMRLKEGDELQLSDGTGLRIQAVVDDPKSGIVRVLGFTKEERPVVRLGLIQALAKNGHDEQAIDMATQIGVDEVTPWQATVPSQDSKRGAPIANGCRRCVRPPSNLGAHSFPNCTAWQQASRFLP